MMVFLDGFSLGLPQIFFSRPFLLQLISGSKNDNLGGVGGHQSVVTLLFIPII